MNPVYKHLQAKNKFMGLDLVDFAGVLVFFGFYLMFTDKLLQSLLAATIAFLVLYFTKRNKPTFWTWLALQFQFKDKSFASASPPTGGFFQKLPYFGFDDDCLINADGSVSLGYKLNGIDVHCMEGEEINALSSRLNDMVDSLDTNSTIQFIFDSKNLYDIKDKIFDRYLDQIDKKIPFSLLLAQSKVLHFRQLKLFQSNCHLFISKTSPKPTNKFKKTNPFETLPERLEKLRQNKKTIGTNLKTLNLKPQNLSAEEMKEFIYGKLNPDRMTKFPYQPGKKKFSHNETTIRSELWMSGMTVYRDHLFYDNIHARSITFHSLPEYTSSAFLMPLLEGIRNLQPLDYQLSVQMEVVNQQKEILEQKMKRNITHILQNFGSKRDYAAEAGNQDAEAVLQTMAQEGKRIYHVSLIFTLFSKNLKELNEQTEYVLHAFRGIGGSDGMVEEYGQEQAFLSSLPAGNIPFHRKFKFLSHNMGDLCPVYERWKGCEIPATLFLNDRNSLVSYNLFDQKQLENFNALLVGASGMGKSFCVSYLTSSYASQGYPVWFVDIGGSYKRMINCYGGDYFEFGTSDALNPLCRIDEYDQKRHLALIGIIEAMLVEKNRDLSYEQKNFIGQSIKTLYENWQSSEIDEPLLTDLHNVMEKMATSEMNRSLLGPLKYWIDGPYSALFNRKSSINPQKSVVGFDLKSLGTEGRKIVLLIIASMIGSLIEKTPQPKIIVFDECWDLIRSGAQVIENLYRTGRKNNLSVMSVTQSMTDFVTCPISGAILSNSAVRYALPVREGWDLLEEHLKLNQRELEIIKLLKQEKGYFSEMFVQFGSHHTILRLSPSPLEYWMCTTHANDIALEKEFTQRLPGAPRIEVLMELSTRHPHGTAG